MKLTSASLPGLLVLTIASIFMIGLLYFPGGKVSANTSTGKTGLKTRQKYHCSNLKPSFLTRRRTGTKSRASMNWQFLSTTSQMLEVYVDVE